MNFALVLFLLLVVTGVMTLADRMYFAKRRVPGEKEPWWIEYPKSFFPVILIVFVLRSFIVEPFRIPSDSMLPTLVDGDFILVNKYTYGVRLPIINKKIIDLNDPQRGDVIVFRYPVQPSLDYIKRVVGLPGDRVAYINKRLSINGMPVPMEPARDYLHPQKLSYSKRYIESIGDVRHAVLNDAEAPAGVPFVKQFPFRDNCVYNADGFVCTVPPGHYFLMGDNRDNSSDSRVWGFVPDSNIVGKAFFIWFNFGDLDRIGSFQ